MNIEFSDCMQLLLIPSHLLLPPIQPREGCPNEEGAQKVPDKHSPSMAASSDNEDDNIVPIHHVVNKRM